MTIHGVGYRSFEFVPVSMVRRLWPVAAQEYRALFRRWHGILIFIVCMAPHLGSLGFLLVQNGVWQVGLDPEELQRRMLRAPRMNPAELDFYLGPVIGRESFVLFLALTSLVSCRAIAKDRQTDALELYWTRGIGPLGYFVAKWLGSAMLVGTSYVAAPLVLWLLAVLMAPDWQLLEHTLRFMPSVVVALVAFNLVLTYVAVAFSALARHANQASMFWFALMAGTGIFGQVLARVFRGEWWCKAVSPWNAMQRIAEWIAGIAPRQNYDPWIAVASIAVLLALLTALTARRLRVVEAVG